MPLTSPPFQFLKSWLFRNELTDILTSFSFFQGGNFPAVWQYKCMNKLEQLSLSFPLVSFSLNNFPSRSEVYVCLLFPPTEFWQQHVKNRMEGLFVCASCICFHQELHWRMCSHRERKVGTCVWLAGLARRRQPAGSEQACPLHLLPRERNRGWLVGWPTFPAPQGGSLGCLTTTHGGSSRAQSWCQ